jgi:thiamine transport system permease protein
MTAKRLLVFGPLAYLALFFLYPLVAILGRSFEGGALSPEPFKALLGDSYYLGRIWFTVMQATVSTVVTLAVGLPAAYLFAKNDFPGKTVLKALTTLPFIMPTIVVAMGFVALLGPQGLLNTALMSLFGLDGPPVRVTNTLMIIFMAHAFYNYAIVVRIVSAFWGNLTPRFEESAMMLGASRLQIFLRVTIPLLLPAITSAAVLVFAFSFTSFGVVLVLGGPQFATMEVAIYDLTVTLFRLELAGALAVVQMMFTYVFLLIYARFQQRTGVPISLVPQEVVVGRKRRGRETALMVAIVVGLLVLLSPLVALVERAASVGDAYSLTHFASLFSNNKDSYFYLSPIAIVWNSVRFALASMVVALLVGTASAYFIARPRKYASVADALSMMPLGVSAVTLGFGFLVAFNRPPMDLRASWVILVIAHSLVAYPFVIRSVLPVLRGIPRHLNETAAVLGASPLRIFIHVELPILGRALLVGATFAFAVSMGEFGASLLLVRPEFTTIPVAIFRLLGQPGETNLGQALAMASLLMAIVALGFVAIERFRYRDVGGF